MALTMPMIRTGKANSLVTLTRTSAMGFRTFDRKDRETGNLRGLDLHPTVGAPGR